MTLNGIDISGWQPNIDLAQVPADFVIIKATGGTGFVSQSCEPQFQQAKKLGRLKGIYHFAHEEGYRGTATQEADHFISSTRGYHDGATMLVLDWEGDNTHDTAWALAWLQRVESATGIKPVIYMSAAVANEANWTTVAKAGYGLWIAAYVLGYQQINGYNIPSGLAPVPYWETLAIWQYTSAGRLTGWAGDLDLNVFYGDAAAWLKYCAKAGATSPAPAPAKPVVTKPAPAPVAKPAAAGTYTVKSGDSLSAIAAKYGTTYTELARINGIANPNLIQPGQVLRVTGGAAAAPAAPATYTVRGGDNLSSIAAAHGTTWQKLAQLNGLANPDYIQAGQTLRLR